jgi:hypothetical protein
MTTRWRFDITDARWCERRHVEALTQDISGCGEAVGKGIRGRGAVRARVREGSALLEGAVGVLEVLPGVSELLDTGQDAALLLDHFAQVLHLHLGAHVDPEGPAVLLVRVLFASDSPRQRFGGGFEALVGSGGWRSGRHSCS